MLARGGLFRASRTAGSEPAARRVDGAAALRGDQALALLDAGADAVLGVDAYGRVLFANATAETVFAVAEGALTGTGAEQWLPQLSRAVHALRLRLESGAAGAGVTGEATEVAACRADGRPFPALVWLTPLRRGRRMLIGITVRDLSEQRRGDADRRRQLAEVTRLKAVAARSQAEVSAVLRAVTDRVIIVSDAQGRITAFNRAAEKLLGYTAAEMIGRPTTRLSDPEEVAAVAAELGLGADCDPLLELTRSGLHVTQDWSFLTVEGERRPVSLRITAIGQRTDPAGFVCVAEPRTAGFSWTPTPGAAPTASGSDRLLLDLDDAETRSLRWQVGGTRYARKT